MPHGPNALRALQNGDIRGTPNGTLEAPPHDAGMPTRSELVDRLPDGSNQRWQQKVAGTIATDAALGSLLEKMETLGVLDSTLVIVMMDHGMIAKDTIYEGGTRIAMMARLPGVIPGGSTLSRRVTNLDVVPTILEFAHTRAQYNVDGISWLNDARGGRRREAADDRQFIFYEIDSDRAVLDVQTGVKLISRLASAVEEVANYPASVDVLQLYDTAADPTEQRNVASDPTYGQVLDRLQAALACQEQRTRRSNPEIFLTCDRVATASPSRAPAVLTETSPPAAAPTWVPTVADASGTPGAASSSDDSAALSSGATVGIVLVALLIVGALLAILFVRQRRGKEKQLAVVNHNDLQDRELSAHDNPVYDHTDPFDA